MIDDVKERGSNICIDVYSIQRIVSPKKNERIM